MSESEGSESTWERLLATYRVEPFGAEHAPRVALLGCSDARVSPARLFDLPRNSLFVVRVAGNTVSPAVLASLDFAVDQLGVDLIVVKGHTGCGAVAAAAAGTCGGYLAPIVEPICEVAAAHPDATPEELVHLNVDATVAALRGHDGPTGAAARAGTVEIRGAVHDLPSGELLIHPPT